MRTIIVDDEKFAIEELKYFLASYDVQIEACYQSGDKVLKELQTTRPELVFLDIDMPRMNGIELALKIQEELPDVFVVFVTAHSDYALDSFQAHPLDFVLKPIEEDKFKKTMEVVNRNYMKAYPERRHEIKTPHDMKISCFGKFSILNEASEPMKFPTKKAKELFAYLICNMGKNIYRDEILDQIFGGFGEKEQNNYYVTLYRLRSSLNNFGVTRDQITIKENASLSMESSLCDLTALMEFLAKNTTIDQSTVVLAEAMLSEYHGEILSDIDSEWADETRQWAENRIEQTMLNMAVWYNKSGDRSASERTLNRLLTVNPISTDAMEMLLDLAIRYEDEDMYRNIFRNYERVLRIEFGQKVPERYSQHENVLTK